MVTQFIRVTLIYPDGDKVNSLVNISEIERFEEGATKEGGVTRMYLKSQKLQQKDDVKDIFHALTTPMEKIMERLVEVGVKPFK